MLFGSSNYGWDRNSSFTPKLDKASSSRTLAIIRGIALNELRSPYRLYKPCKLGFFSQPKVSLWRSQNVAPNAKTTGPCSSGHHGSRPIGSRRRWRSSQRRSIAEWTSKATNVDGAVPGYVFPSPPTDASADADARATLLGSDLLQVSRPMAHNWFGPSWPCFCVMDPHWFWFFSSTATASQSMIKSRTSINRRGEFSFSRRWLSWSHSSKI